MLLGAVFCDIASTWIVPALISLPITCAFITSVERLSLQHFALPVVHAGVKRSIAVLIGILIAEGLSLGTSGR